jgi:hypothetical protein
LSGTGNGIVEEESEQESLQLNPPPCIQLDDLGGDR